MNLEDFKRELRDKGYSYREEGGRLVVEGNLISDLTQIPPGVIFQSDGEIWMNSLKAIPFDVEFRNGGWVYLRSVEKIDPSVRFHNENYGVYLGRFHSFSALIENTFSTGRSTWTFEFKIPGISDRRILNRMISIGLFA